MARGMPKPSTPERMTRGLQAKTTLFIRQRSICLGATPTVASEIEGRGSLGGDPMPEESPALLGAGLSNRPFRRDCLTTDGGKP